MSNSPGSLRCPPTNKRGTLTRRAVTIPKKQLALLEKDGSWFSKLGNGDGSQVNEVERLRILSTAAAKALKSKVAAAAASAPTIPETEPLATAATTPKSTSLAEFVKDAPAEESTPSRGVALAREPPSAVSLPSLQAQVSPPPARTNVQSTAPPAATARTSDEKDLLAASESLGRVEDTPSQTQPRHTTVAVAQPDPARYDRSSPPNPDCDKQEGAALDKQETRQEITETVGRQASEIPATPEKQLQGQFQKTDEPTGEYSPDWPEDEDDEEDEDEDEDEDEYDDGDDDFEKNSHETATFGTDARMQEDGADQEDEAQKQTEQGALAAVKTPRRLFIDRTRSPNLSSSPQDDLEYQPVQALVHPRNSEAHSPAVSNASAQYPAPQSSTRFADAMAAQTASSVPSYRASPTPSSKSHVQSVTLPAQAQPQPTNNSSRAPSEDGTPGVRRRLMKAPVFPISSKSKRAGTQQHPRMETPDSSLFVTKHAYHRRSSLALPVYTPTSGSNSPLTPVAGHGDAADGMDISPVKRRESIQNSVEKPKLEDVQQVLALEEITAAAAAPTPARVSALASAPASASSASAAAAATTHASYQISPAQPSVPTQFAAAAAVQPTYATPSYATATPSTKAHNLLYRTSAANSPRSTLVSNSALDIRESPSMSPRHTWMLPYETFTSAYPEYTGDLEDFLRACYCLQGISKARQLASYQFDDVVRAYLEYIEYVHDAASTAPLNLHQWYLENTDELLYNKNVVTRSNVNTILMAYPDKVHSIQLLAEPVAKSAPAPAPAPALAAATHEPPVTASINNNSNDMSEDDAHLPQAMQLDDVDQSDRPSTTPSQPLTLPAGRRLSIDSMQQRGSQDDSVQSVPNSLLNLSILVSSGESVWHHGQPSSPGDIAHEDDSIQSQILSQDMGMSQHDSLRQLDSVPQPDSQIQSSCLTNAENELPLPRSPISTAVLPRGMDRMTYMLQSPPSVPSTDPRLRPHIPSQSNESPGGHLPSYQKWAMADDEESVAETPAKTKARTPVKTPVRSLAKSPTKNSTTSQAKKARLQPITNSPEKTPAISVTALTPTGRKRSWEDRENQPPALADLAEKSPAARQDPENNDISDDPEFGDEYSEMDVSVMSVQSAQEVRHRPSPVQPRARVETRRATIAGPDIGMIARLAAAEEALVAATENRSPPPPLLAKATMTATPSEPPKKKRKKVAAGKKTMSRKTLADFLAKKAAEKGIISTP